MVGPLGVAGGAWKPLAAVVLCAALTGGLVQAQSIIRVINNSETDTIMRVPIAEGVSGRIDLGPGRYRILAECGGGTGCTPLVITGMRLNGRETALPAPTESLELRLDSAAAVRSVSFSTCGNPCNGEGGFGGGRIGGQGGGRYTFYPRILVTAEGTGDSLRLRVSADVSTLRVQNYPAQRANAAPSDNDDRGGDGGGAGGGAGVP